MTDILFAPEMIFPPLSHSTLQVKAGTYFSIHYKDPLNEKSGPLFHFASPPLSRERCCWKWLQTNSIMTACTLAMKIPILTYYVTSHRSDQTLYKLNQWGQCALNFKGLSKESLMKNKVEVKKLQSHVGSH